LFVTDLSENLPIPVTMIKPSLTLKMGRIGYPETSVTNYELTLRNIPEGRKPEITQI